MEQKFLLSPFLQAIPDPASDKAMVYHALYGNPLVVNGEALRFLETFREPKTVAEAAELCDGDPTETVRKFASVHFLVEPEIDEKHHLHRQKAQHLLKVSAKQTIDRMGLAISDNCNFGCPHCLHFQPVNGKVLPIYDGSRSQLSMSWETAKKCIDQVIALTRSNGQTNLKISFGNAEPLLNWPVIQKVLLYCNTFPDMTFQFAINTNLVLMTKEIAEYFKRYQVDISTSLDGNEQANNAIRITKGGKGTFQRIVEKFDLLAEIGYPLDGFSITVTSGNFHLIDTDIVDLAAEREMVNIAFDYDLIGLVNVSVSERVEKLMRLKKYANSRGIDFFGTWDTPFRNLTSGSLLTDSQFFCAAVEGRSLEFNVDGSIKVCNHTTTRVGHVDNLNVIFHRGGGLFKMVEDRFPGTDEYCGDCMIEGPCGGQCHVTREVVSRSIGEKRQRIFSDMCDFYRTVTKALTLEYLQSNETIILGNQQE